MVTSCWSGSMDRRSRPAMQSRDRGGPAEWTLRYLHDRDLRFKDAGAAAGGTLRWLGELVFVEREAAAPAARRFDRHRVPGGARRPDQVLEVLFNLAAFEAKLARHP